MEFLDIVFNEHGSVSEELVTEFIPSYLEYEGIELEREKLIKNPGLQTFAKAILSSLWGKFSQNENNTLVHFVQDYECIDSIRWIYFIFKNRKCNNCKFCYKLHTFEKKRVLYCNTDSLIYFSKSGESKIEMGSYLGMSTNNLKQK